MERLLIIDGHSYAYRAFHAIRELHSPSGQPTNAIYGFIKMLAKLRATVDPTHWMVVWDGGLSAGRLAVFRHVYWPAIRPGVFSGAILGFAVSFDEVVIALFLQGPNTITLPVRMFSAIQFELTPKVAASASLFILLATLALIAQSLLPARRPA